MCRVNANLIPGRRVPATLSKGMKQPSMGVKIPVKDVKKMYNNQAGTDVTSSIDNNTLDDYNDIFNMLDFPADESNCPSTGSGSNEGSYVSEDLMFPDVWFDTGLQAPVITAPAPATVTGTTANLAIKAPLLASLLDDTAPTEKVREVGEALDVVLAPTTVPKTEAPASPQVFAFEDLLATGTVSPVTSTQPAPAPAHKIELLMQPQEKKITKIELSSSDDDSDDDNEESLPTKTSRRRRRGSVGRGSQPKKLYEHEPFEDPVLEKKRLDAIHAKENRDKKKKERNGLVEENKALKKENRSLKRKQKQLESKIEDMEKTVERLMAILLTNGNAASISPANQVARSNILLSSFPKQVQEAGIVKEK